MAGQQGAGILDAGGTLERRFGQVAHLGGDVDDDREDQPVPPDFIGVGEGDRSSTASQVFARCRRSPPAASRLPATDAIEPSQVLLGLRVGASLCRPKARPMYRAAMSPAHTTQSRNTTSDGPLCWACSAGRRDQGEARVEQAEDGVDASGKHALDGLREGADRQQGQARMPRMEAAWSGHSKLAANSATIAITTARRGASAPFCWARPRYSQRGEQRPPRPSPG